MKIILGEFSVVRFLGRHFDSSYCVASAVVFHFGCLWLVPKNDLLTTVTAILLLVAFSYNIYAMFWSKKTRARARESRKLRIEIARLGKEVPVHIPDEQVLKYLKKKIKIDKKKRKEENELSEV